MRLVPESEVPLGNVARLVLGMDDGREPAKDVDKRQLAIGMAVELEHTDDPREAERITRQHLAEDGEYYTKPMKKDWGADEAKDRVEELAKAAQSSNPIAAAESIADEILDANGRPMLASVMMDRWPINATQARKIIGLLPKYMRGIRFSGREGYFSFIDETSKILVNYSYEKDRWNANTSNWDVNASNCVETTMTRTASGTEPTWHQIRAEHDPDGTNHDLTLTCTECGRSQTCRCSKPKRKFAGICDKCSQKSKEAIVKGCEDEIEEALGQKRASVFVFEDDPERLAIFRRAFGSANVTSTCKVADAMGHLRRGGFSRIYLDRDVSSVKENGEDLAWQMEKEALCKGVPIVIHSENTRGQKVMARYIGRYHSAVSVIPFRKLKEQLDKPGAGL